MRLSVRSRLLGAGWSRWLRVAVTGWSGNAVLSATAGVPVVPIVRLAEIVRTAGLLAVAGVAVGAVAAVVLRWCGLAWSWALPTLLAVPVAVLIGWQAAIGYGAAAIAAVGTGVYLHVREVLAGGDLATRARQRRGITDATRARVVRRRITDRRVGHGRRGRGWPGPNRRGCADPGLRIAGGHDPGRRRDRVGQDGDDGADGSGRDPAGLRRGRGRPEARRLPVETARRCGAARGAPTNGLVAGWRLGLQPVPGRYRHRDRRQDPLNGDLHRASLPAARPAISGTCRPVAPCG